tara:strand:+ start:2832 stop:3593 length:762 start_codon:yes stop_codon:yes gene_type:complete
MFESLSSYSSYQLLTLGFASFIMGMSRGGIGGGFGLVGVLLAAQIMPPITAAAFLLPILVVTDPFAYWLYRKHVLWRSMNILLAGGLIGMLTGAITIKLITPEALKIFIGLLALILVGDGLMRHFRKVTEPRILGPIWGLLSGSLAGYSSFLIHSGLPPIAAYLLPQNITRQAFLGTVAVFFSICNFLKIVPYWYLGIFNFDLIGLTSLFIPISFVGLFVGRIINHFLTDRIFFIIVYITIFALGVRLIWTGV